MYQVYVPLPFNKDCQSVDHLFVKEFERVLRWIVAAGSSFNLYMFHGGTNFGLTSGANDVLGATNEPNIVNYSPAVTSYGLTMLLSLLLLLVRVPTPPGKSWIFFLKIPGPGKSWKITLVVESTGN